jgi:hypothetical protein
MRRNAPAGFGRSGPGQYRALLEQAQRRGVRGRLEVTGYLDDAAYGAALRQADLAVCPFEDNKAASGSLSSLIAVDCPILASDTHLIAEYNALSAGAIATFSPFTPRALAARILARWPAPSLVLWQLSQSVGGGSAHCGGPERVRPFRRHHRTLPSADRAARHCGAM